MVSSSQFQFFLFYLPTKQIFNFFFYSNCHQNIDDIFQIFLREITKIISLEFRISVNYAYTEIFLLFLTFFYLTVLLIFHYLSLHSTFLILLLLFFLLITFPIFIFTLFSISHPIVSLSNNILISE